MVGPLAILLGSTLILGAAHAVGLDAAEIGLPGVPHRPTLEAEAGHSRVEERNQGPTTSMRLARPEDEPCPAKPTLPLRVWIDGKNIDGVPEGRIKPPCTVGVTLWPTGIGSDLSGRSAAGVPTSGSTERVTGINGTVYGQVGRWWAEFDAFVINQTTNGRFLFSGVNFQPGATIEQNDLVLRGAREISRFDTSFGLYHFDLGLRLTSASRTITLAGVERTGNQLHLSPELTVAGRWVADRGMAIHARASYAGSSSGARSEESIEAQVMLNYHWVRTHFYQADVGIGYRVLSTRLGFADDTTGTESTFANLYMGPEFSLGIRF